MTGSAPPLPVGLDVGSGPTVVLLPGYGTRPALYGGTARLLARRCRVVVPDPVAVRGRWRYGEVVERLAATCTALGTGPCSLVAHSFGGALALGLAARHPGQVTEAVFCDTLALSQQWVLAEEALRHPLRLLRMATPPAAASFAGSVLRHPRQLADAAWWGFRSRRGPEVNAVAATSVPTHVLWANRDSLLSRGDGRQFAAALGASFTVVAAAGDVDHDWMYRHPALFVDHLERLGLRALGPGRRVGDGSAAGGAPGGRGSPGPAGPPPGRTAPDAKEERRDHRTRDHDAGRRVREAGRNGHRRGAQDGRAGRGGTARLQRRGPPRGDAHRP